MIEREDGFDEKVLRESPSFKLHKKFKRSSLTETVLMNVCIKCYVTTELAIYNQSWNVSLNILFCPSLLCNLYVIY